MAAVAMILQRDVAVADESVKGGHAMVSTAGFTIVAPARKVTAIIGYDAARGPKAARSELKVMKGAMPDTRLCVTLLHVNDYTHFKRILPVHTGHETGQH